MEKLREGKLSRLYYWIFMLAIMLIAVFLLLVPPAMIDDGSAIVLISFFLIIIVYYAVIIMRLRDAGKSPWLALTGIIAAFLPDLLTALVGLIFLIVVGVWKSEEPYIAEHNDIKEDTQ